MIIKYGEKCYFNLAMVKTHSDLGVVRFSLIADIFIERIVDEEEFELSHQVQNYRELWLVVKNIHTTNTIF